MSRLRMQAKRRLYYKHRRAENLALVNSSALIKLVCKTCDPVILNTHTVNCLKPLHKLVYSKKSRAQGQESNLIQ